MMKSFMMIAGLVLLLGVSATAFDFKELPADLSNLPTVAVFDAGEVEIDNDCVGARLSAPPTTPWGPLEAMTEERRANARIDLVLESATSKDVLNRLRKIESTWNAGKYDEALALFPELDAMTDLSELGIGTSWLVPLQSAPNPKWADDIRIGARDSIYATALCTDVSSGNVFAVLLHVGDGAVSRWTMNFSDDGGLTWTETFQYASGTYEMPVIAATAVDGHVYVAQTYATTSVSLRRFRGTDGANILFQGGQSINQVFNPATNGGIVELEMSSNQDWLNNRIYVAAILGDGTAVMYWDNQYAASFLLSDVGVTNAERGLSICVNEGYSTYHMFMSVIDDTDTLRIRGNSGVSWSQRWSYPVNSTSLNLSSSMAAYHDTVHCYFDYKGDRPYCRYLVSYNGGSTFLYGAAHDTTVTSEAPAVCARGGGGVGMVYRYYTSPRQGRFVWRNYAGSWSDEEIYTDNAPYYNQPDIEYLGNGEFGVLFLSWNSPVVRGAFFDISTRCCTGPSVGNVDSSADNLVTMGDLTTLIDHMFISLVPLACNDEGNVDMSPDGLVTMGDLTTLIDAMFISLDPLPPCP